jgi:sulfur-carrier protein
MKTEVIFFGQLADKTNCSSVMIQNPGTIGQFRKVIIEQYPALANAKFTVALNNKIALDNEPVTENATIALMPPFSGG